MFSTEALIVTADNTKVFMVTWTPSQTPTHLLYLNPHPQCISPGLSEERRAQPLFSSLMRRASWSALDLKQANSEAQGLWDVQY